MRPDFFHCTKCGREKRRDEFYAHSRRCKRCRSLQVRANMLRCSDSFLANLYSGCKMRHKRSGFPESTLLSKEAFLRVFAAQEGRCALTGEELAVSGNPFQRPSPDRIDNSKGYTEDNVHFVTWLANSCRGQLALDDFVAFCRSVSDHARRAPSDAESRAPEPHLRLRLQDVERAWVDVDPAGGVRPPLAAYARVAPETEVVRREASPDRVPGALSRVREEVEPPPPPLHASGGGVRANDAQDVLVENAPQSEHARLRWTQK